jgi:DNA-binding MarR family transcriptional regulator
MGARLTDADYERLLEFRAALRRFLKWSGSQAARVGIPPTQHQLLLAIRGSRDHERGPTIGAVAESLVLKPHSAVELVDRATAAGLVERVADEDDQRVVRLRLTARGAEKLEAISVRTFDELEQIVPHLRAVERAARGR